MNEALKYKIGQMICAGFPSPEVDGQAERLAADFKVGNFILFTRNIISAKQLCDLNNGLRKLALDATGIAPLIGIDQEGGAVSRYYEGAALIPGAMALSASGGQAAQVGYTLGSILKAVGFSMNYAPVLDVNIDPRNPIIGSRSFGDDVDQVAARGIAMMRGMKEAGMIACVKHYSGHGNVMTDSHLDLPVNDTPREVLEKTEWVPFIRAFTAGADALMSAHIHYAAITDHPATLSKEIMTDILRGEQHFEGIATTDCMEMGAIRKLYGCGEGAVRAIEAGIDLLHFSHTYEAVKEGVEAIYAAVESGRLTEARINQSYERILRVKKKYDLAHADADYSLAMKLVHDPKSIKENWRMMADSITCIKDAALLKELNGKKIACFAPVSSVLTGVEDQRRSVLSFADQFAAGFEDAKAVVVPLNEMTDAVRAEIAGDYEVAVMGLYNAGLRKEQLAIYEALKKTGKPVVAVLLGVPYDYAHVKDADAVVAGYEYTPLSVPALIEAMKECRYPGKLPVNLEFSPI